MNCSCYYVFAAGAAELGWSEILHDLVGLWVVMGVEVCELVHDRSSKK